MSLTRTDDFERVANPIGGSFTSVQLTVECDGHNAQALGASTVKDSAARHNDDPVGRHKARVHIAVVAAGNYVSAEVCLQVGTGGNRTAYTYYTEGLNGTLSTNVGKIVNGTEVANVSRDPPSAFVVGDWIEIEYIPNLPSAGQNTLRAYQNGTQVGADIVDNGTTFGGASGSGAIITGGSYGLSLFGGGEASDWEGIDPNASSSATAVISGDILSATTETDIVTGGRTIVITLSGDQWVPDSVHPLTVAAGGRWLQRADGTPFHINGDTPWELATNLTPANVTTYLTDRSARGVNAVLWEMIEHKFTEQTPKWKNKNGDVPFSGTVGGELDFTTPVSAYWNHIDWVIGECNRFGMVCLVTPAYIGFAHGDEGWAAALNANGDTRMQTYGVFLGNRYKDYPNIIWVMGGDEQPVNLYDLTSEINALANGIKSVDGNHLMTAHNRRALTAYDDYNQPWLDLNSSYGDKTTIHLEIRTAYQQVTMPTFLIEGSYGNESDQIDLELRKEMYQAVLGGGVGHLYGQSPMWYFGVDAAASGNAFATVGGLDWHNTLNSYGSNFLIYVKRLQAARPLHLLVPDYTHTVVTAGYGTEDLSYAPSLYSNQIMVAYTSGVALTVDKTEFVSATFDVNWYNVRTGATTSGGTAAFGTGSQVFTPPDGNDWVLLLNDQALGLGNP